MNFIKFGNLKLIKCIHHEASDCTTYLVFIGIERDVYSSFTFILQTHVQRLEGVHKVETKSPPRPLFDSGKQPLKSCNTLQESCRDPLSFRVQSAVQGKKIVRSMTKRPQLRIVAITDSQDVFLFY